MSAKLRLCKVLFVFAAITFNVSQFSAQPTNAATIGLIQQWELSLGSPDTFTTGARWDNTGLTGVGTEFFFLERFTASRFLNDIGQFSAAAQFTSPQSLALPGNTVARYVNGIFDGFGNTNSPGGGTASVQLVIEATSQGAGGYGWDEGPGVGPLFVYFPPISGRGEYRLVSSEFVNLTPVPLPAALPLLAGGLGLIGLVGWRRKRTAAAA